MSNSSAVEVPQSRMEIFANQVANELSEEFEEYRSPWSQAFSDR